MVQHKDLACLMFCYFRTNEQRHRKIIQGKSYNAKRFSNCNETNIDNTSPEF